MSLTADLSEKSSRVIGGSVDPSRSEPDRPTDEDTVEVTCAACGTRQRVSGRALGYQCGTCGSDWRVLRCPECRKASVVLEGVSTCPRCGHDHAPQLHAARPRVDSWLTEPEPLSVWLGGVKYLGGHSERDQPMGSAGLLLDRRGIHLRAFAELFTIRWDSVIAMDIEGPLDIADRMTMTRLLELGATTWAMQVSYLTVHTAHGDAIFEVDGLSPPELHARLSRVLQGLEPSELPATPIALERRVSQAHRPAPTAPPATAPVAAAPAPVPPPVTAPAAPAPPAFLAPLPVEPSTSDAPLEVLVVDALWKLTHLREVGMLSDPEVGVLRARLLAHIPELAGIDGSGDVGPLLHV